MQHGRGADGRARPQREPRERRRSCGPSCSTDGVRLASGVGLRGHRGAHRPRRRPARGGRRRRDGSGIEGAYSVTALSDGVARRRSVTRSASGPLVLGRIGEDWVVASETCALDLIGADAVREVQPGEVVWSSTTEGLHAAQALPAAEERTLHLRARLLRPARLAAGRGRGARRPRADGRAAGRGGAGRGRPRHRRSPTPVRRLRSASRRRPGSRSTRR